jgi:hypothetical protein
MSKEIKTNGPTRYETLFGGTTVTVDLADHQKQEVIDRQVKIRQIKIGEYPDVFRVHENDAELIRMLTDLPESEINNLSQPSATLLMSEIRRLNVDFFAWCRPKMEQMQGILRQLPAEQMEAIAKIGQSHSATTSPNSLRRPVSVAGSP